MNCIQMYSNIINKCFSLNCCTENIKRIYFYLLQHIGIQVLHLYDTCPSLLFHLKVKTSVATINEGINRSQTSDGRNDLPE